MENNELMEYIQRIVDEKVASDDWDKKIDGQPENLVSNLLYEYSSSIEILTEGKITSKQIIDKLSTQMED